LKLIIRTDSSQKIGSGHLMRSLTLAEELKRNGSNVTFISRAHAGNMNFIISQKGFKVLELPKPEPKQYVKSTNPGDNYNQWLGVSQQQDAKESINKLGQIIFDWLIIDHYGLDEVWEKEMRPYVRNIMVIDDLANRTHDCDLLLDQNWFNDKESRYNGLVPTGCTKLLGPQYALLRSEFSKARKNLQPRSGKIRRIFIFFGGSDPYNLTGMTLKALSVPELAHLEVDVVIGASNPNKIQIEKLTESRSFTHLHFQVDNMAELMAKADFAIGSGGVNTWERICLKLFSFTASFADNQSLLLGSVNEAGVICHLGNISELAEIKIKQILLDQIPKLNLSKIDFGKIEVDGKGVIRVSNTIQNNMLSICFITDQDSWINDYIDGYINKLKEKNHRISLTHNINNVTEGDICILLGCGQYMSDKVRKKNKHNIVIHESALPRGRGWSPLTWQILEGQNTIKISLLEVDEKIDSGDIYFQDGMQFEGHELIEEMRKVQAEKSFSLCDRFIKNFPKSARNGKKQKGTSTYYRKRNPEDSELDITKPLIDYFNLLRTVDNLRYPAFFYYNKQKYKLRIEKF